MVVEAGPALVVAEAADRDPMGVETVEAAAIVAVVEGITVKK